jgi:hypothetical protein
MPKKNSPGCNCCCGINISLTHFDSGGGTPNFPNILLELGDYLLSTAIPNDHWELIFNNTMIPSVLPSGADFWLKDLDTGLKLDFVKESDGSSVISFSFVKRRRTDFTYRNGIASSSTDGFRFTISPDPFTQYLDAVEVTIDDGVSSFPVLWDRSFARNTGAIGNVTRPNIRFIRHPGMIAINHEFRTLASNVFRNPGILSESWYSWPEAASEKLKLKITAIGDDTRIANNSSVSTLTISAQKLVRYSSNLQSEYGYDYDKCGNGHVVTQSGNSSCSDFKACSVVYPFGVPEIRVKSVECNAIDFADEPNILRQVCSAWHESDAQPYTNPASTFSTWQIGATLIRKIYWVGAEGGTEDYRTFDGTLDGTFGGSTFNISIPEDASGIFTDDFSIAADPDCDTNVVIGGTVEFVARGFSAASSGTIERFIGTATGTPSSSTAGFPAVTTTTTVGYIASNTNSAYIPFVSTYRVRAVYSKSVPRWFGQDMPDIEFTSADIVTIEEAGPFNIARGFESVVTNLGQRAPDPPEDARALRWVIEQTHDFTDVTTLDIDDCRFTIGKWA